MHVRTFEMLAFYCTVFYSVQIVLFSIPCLRMVFLDYVKEGFSLTTMPKKNSVQIVRCLAKEGHMASEVGVMNFLWCYRETGTIAQVPGTGRASKVTLEIRSRVMEEMEKNDESTGMELQKLLQKEVEGFGTSLPSVLRWKNDLGWTAKGTQDTWIP